MNNTFDDLLKKIQQMESQSPKDGWNKLSDALDKEKSKKPIIFWIIPFLVGIMVATYFVFPSNGSKSNTETKQNNAEAKQSNSSYVKKNTKAEIVFQNKKIAEKKEVPKENSQISNQYFPNSRINKTNTISTKTT